MIALNFVLVGPMKTGTSWIYEYFKFHKQVCVPLNVKETFFFDVKYSRGFEWYFSHFNSQGDQIVGEVAPTYFHSPLAPERIYDLNPNCQIVITLREPLDRLVSLYFHFLQRGIINKSDSFKDLFRQHSEFLESSFYYRNSLMWLNLFGQDRVKILLYENFKNSQFKFMENLSSYLGLNVIDIPPHLNHKVNDSKVPIDRNLAKLVYAVVHFLRYYDIDLVVNLGKHLGLKKLLFNNKTFDFSLAQDDYNFVFEMVAEDLEMFSKNIDIDLTPWHEIWDSRGLKPLYK
ncbi:MAG: sulfotransferase domain-containing protein [Chloroflexaceae bacterium]|nr:sulfotransferase domain-containing protein [Chloroflexaceae bacterium]